MIKHLPLTLPLKKNNSKSPINKEESKANNNENTPTTNEKTPETTSQPTIINGIILANKNTLFMQITIQVEILQPDKKLIN